MILENFNLKNEQYRDYRNDVASLLKNRDPMPAKECIVENYEILDAVVKGFEALYERDADGNVTNKTAIDNARQDVSVLRINKKEVPVKWNGKEVLKAIFLIHDWDENPVAEEE